MDSKKIIQELNIIFEKRGWELLPEDNKYRSMMTWNRINLQEQLYLDSERLSYEKHLNKYTKEELDEYVMEYIEPVCKKYGITHIHIDYRETKIN